MFLPKKKTLAKAWTSGTRRYGDISAARLLSRAHVSNPSWLPSWDESTKSRKTWKLG